VVGATYERSTARKNVGIYLGPRGSVSAGFELARPTRLSLRIRHLVLKNYVPGNTRVQISIDGRIVVPAWGPPDAGYREESIPLGPVAAGAHTFRLKVLPRSPTYYSIQALELVPAR
jgi:hypothetical protein